jgi:hypothetical protein
MKHLAALAALVLFTTEAHAVRWPDDDDHALPCRPTIACTADLVPPGDAEIEVGYIVRKLTAAWQHSTPVLLKLTLASWTQLQIGSNGGVFASGPTPASYADDIVIGLKFHLHDQTPEFPSLSLSAEASIPLTAQLGYLRTYDALLTAYVTKDVGRIHADVNLGMNLWRLEGPLLLQAWAALALSMELPRRFGIMAEVYTFTDAAPVAPHDGGLLFAATYSPRPWMVIDVGGDLGFANTRAASGFVGLTLVPVRLWGGKRLYARR